MSKKDQNTIEKFIEYFEGKQYICEFTKNKMGMEIYADVISNMNRLKLLYELEIEHIKSQAKAEVLEEVLKEITEQKAKKEELC